MFKTMGLAMAFLVIFGLTGCGVSRDDYDRTKEQLKEAITARDQSIEDLKRARASMEELNVAVERFRGENTRFKAIIVNLEESLAQNATKLKDAKEPKIDLGLTKKLEAASKKMSALSTKIQGLASENKSLQGVNKKLQGSLSKMESQISEYRNKLKTIIQVPAAGDIKKKIPDDLGSPKSIPGDFGKDFFK